MARSTPEQQQRVTLILERYERPLVGYALRLLRNEETARDAVQETFLRLCRERIDLDDPRLGAWLYRVCRNVAIDHLRKERRMHLLDEAERLPTTDAENRPDEAAARRDSAGRLLACVQTLPPRQQEVIWLRFRAGLSYRQIGEVTRASVSHVGVLLHTAMQTLRQRLGEAAVAPRAEEAS